MRQKHTGRHSIVSLEEQKAAFLAYKRFFKNVEDLPPKNSKVFIAIRNRLGLRMSTAALSLSLKRNYKTFFGDVDFTQTDDEEINLTNLELLNTSETSGSNHSNSTHSIKKTVIHPNIFKPPVECRPKPNNIYSHTKPQPDIDDALRRTEETLIASKSNKKDNLKQRKIDDDRILVSSRTPHEDEFYFFAMSVAAQLRNLPLNVALKMQVKIQDELYIARTQGLILEIDNTPTTPHRFEIECNPLEIDEVKEEMDSQEEN